MTAQSRRAIVVDGLAKRFGARVAVRGLSFEVDTGELFGFLGPNGAGKTTTINMLCALLRPSAGSALVNGYDVVRQRADVRRSVGLVFQQQAVDEYLTGEQNLRLSASAYGIPRRAQGERLQELLGYVGLWERRRDLVHTYSGGMKRRLEVVRGLLHHPRVLFLDEPTLGVDVQTRRLIWEWVAELRERERLTIFLTTHYMEEAEQCDRVAIVDGGAAVALDTPEKLKAALGGDVVVLEAEDAAAGERLLRERYGFAATVHGRTISLVVPNGDRFLSEVVSGFPERLQAVSIRRPTLEDVFLARTGHGI